ncbi:hypothetical protein [Arthrobacter sp. M4]|uniref:hypothetical protein n=1 Tax=Arthrobacter sp. M4 TaxID=218160 RepID=UPI001CDC8B25|nr:hypothetical protein [Arthrobacter sp. M4]MCA4134269.1 hypothetical protein [Arthrobacter sp. M4]
MGASEGADSAAPIRCFPGAEPAGAAPGSPDTAGAAPIRCFPGAEPAGAAPNSPDTADVAPIRCLAGAEPVGAAPDSPDTTGAAPIRCLAGGGLIGDAGWPAILCLIGFGCSSAGPLSSVGVGSSGLDPVGIDSGPLSLSYTPLSCGAR